MLRFLSSRRYFLAKAVNVLAVFAVIVAFSIWADAAMAHDAEVKAQIIEAERAASRGPYATDGVFSGSAQGFGGTVAVEVTIDNGYIDSVELADVSHEDAEWVEMASVLPDRIVEEQSVDIDVVSGATYTSAGILNATAEALEESQVGGQ